MEYNYNFKVIVILTDTVAVLFVRVDLYRYNTRYSNVILEYTFCIVINTEYYAMAPHLLTHVGQTCPTRNIQLNLHGSIFDYRIPYNFSLSRACTEQDVRDVS